MNQFWENTDKLFSQLQVLDSNKYLPVQLSHLYNVGRFHLTTLSIYAIASMFPVVMLIKLNNLDFGSITFSNLILEYIANTFLFFMIANACFCVSFIMFFRICFTFLRIQLENAISCNTQFHNSQDKWKMLLWKLKPDDNNHCTTFKYSYNSEKVVKIIEIHESLEMHIEEYNLIWSRKMILSIMHSFLTLLLNGFFACLWIGQGLYAMLLIISWPWLLNIIVLYTITAEGENMKEEAKKFTPLFNLLKSSGKMTDIDKMLKETVNLITK